MLPCNMSCWMIYPHDFLRWIFSIRTYVICGASSQAIYGMRNTLHSGSCNYFMNKAQGAARSSLHGYILCEGFREYLEFSLKSMLLPMLFSIINDSHSGCRIYQTTEPVICKRPSSGPLAPDSVHRRQHKILCGCGRVLDKVRSVRRLDHLEG